MSARDRLPVVEVHNLSAIFPDEQNGSLQALKDLSFAVYQQEFLCILGPSGSGKSTLLRILAGLLPPTAGEVRFAQGHRPRIGMVFQQATLMPWRTVSGNILLPLELMGIPRHQAEAQARELIELVGLRGFEHAWPKDLSGGMVQRVALARALIHDPDLLLLDEPFASLDALTRERMWDELSRIWQARQKTVIMVTHSISEALFLADRILILTPRPGRLRMTLEVDLPRPRNNEMRYSVHFLNLARRVKAVIGTENSDSPGP
jgi:NitT/TauT family transport system ATP-binding protein